MLRWFSDRVALSLVGDTDEKVRLIRWLTRYNSPHLPFFRIRSAPTLISNGSRKAWCFALASAVEVKTPVKAIQVVHLPPTEFKSVSFHGVFGVRTHSFPVFIRTLLNSAIGSIAPFDWSIWLQIGIGSMEGSRTNPIIWTLFKSSGTHRSCTYVVLYSSDILSSMH